MIKSWIIFSKILIMKTSNIDYYIFCKMWRNLDKKYLEKFKLLSSKYGFYLFVYHWFKNKKISDIRNSIKIRKINYIYIRRLKSYITT